MKLFLKSLCYVDEREITFTKYTTKLFVETKIVREMSRNFKHILLRNIAYILNNFMRCVYHCANMSCEYWSITYADPLGTDLLHTLALWELEVG